VKDRSLKPLTRVVKVGQPKKQLDPPSLNSTLPCSDEVLSALVQHSRLSENSYLFQ
jgi:hypothetical protein